MQANMPPLLLLSKRCSLAMVHGASLLPMQSTDVQLIA